MVLMKLKSPYFLIIVLVGLLASCTGIAIKSASLSPNVAGCNAEDYEDIIKSYASELHPGRYRDSIVSALSEIVKEIWWTEHIVHSDCQTRHHISYTPSQPLNSVEFPVTISVFLAPGKLCLNHEDFTGTGKGDTRREQTYEDYPWVYIENKNAPGSGVGKRVFSPVCFDRSGKVDGYLNG